MKLFSFVAVLATNLAVVTGAFAVDVDPALPAYKPAGGLSGQIKSVGSDTMGNLVKQWAEAFKALHPDVQIDVESKGSVTAPPALLEGASQIGPMSRPMSMEEINSFRKKYGYPPSSIPVAVDALAVYVNKANPIECLTLEQVDAIFSKDHWGGGGMEIKTWGKAGLTGDWANEPIALFGRNSLSGTFDTFKETVLRHGEFKDAVKQQVGSEDVVKMVAGDKFGIGYSGIGFLTEGVRAVPLAAPQNGKCYEPSAEFAYSGGYPLARYLRLYFNKKSDRPLDPVITDFIRFVLSKDGQLLTIKAGFYPVPNATRLQALKLLGISGDAS